MELQKICTTCKTANPAHEIVCQRCMADISSVEYGMPKASPQEAPPPAREPVPAADPPGPTATVPAHGADDDTAKTVIQKRFRLRLKLENFEFEVEDGDVIGRSHVGKEVLTQFPGISRRHAIFSWENGRWCIEDLDSTNGTYVNGVAVKSKQKQALNVGDKLSISRKVTFEVISV
jgi:hypothetical protein